MEIPGESEPRQTQITQVTRLTRLTRIASLGGLLSVVTTMNEPRDKVVKAAGGTVEPISQHDLGAFVVEHYPRLIRLAGLLCRNWSDAEDAVQAALERAWRSRERLQEPARVRPWLDRIVVREASRVLGRGRRFAALDLVADRVQPERDDRALAVRHALALLSPEQRSAVVLHLYAGYTVASTADLLGVPEETVRSRLRVAREHLRRALAEGE
jgi:RNA polymerase sigma-70 factor (ECF subfamily)